MTFRRIFSTAILTTYASLAAVLIIAMPLTAQAQDGTTAESCKITGQIIDETTGKKDVDQAIRMQISIPGVTQSVTIVSPDGKTTETFNGVKNMSCYIAGIYRYFAGAAGIITTIMIMYGGFMYVTAFGNPQRISQAKDTITSALIGLAITLGSYVILYTINPNLTTLTLPGVNSIGTVYQDIHWCNAADGDTADAAGHTECGDKGSHINLTTHNKEACTWPGTCPEKQICYSASGTSGNYTCMSAEETCQSAYRIAKECPIINTVMVLQGIKARCIENVDNIGTGNTCFYGDILTCDNGWTQVKCNFGNNNFCWDKSLNRPSGTWPQGERTSDDVCVDGDGFAGNGSICCENNSPASCKFSCEFDEAEVDCAQYSLNCNPNTPKCCVKLYMDWGM